MADAIDYKEICSKQCGAKCCRAPSRMVILREEAELMSLLMGKERAQSTPVVPKDNGTFEMHFKDTGGACPFLDQKTNLCTIYDQRPLACRKYPQVWEEACIISGPGRQNG